MEKVFIKVVGVGGGGGEFVRLIWFLNNFLFKFVCFCDILIIVIKGMNGILILYKWDKDSFIVDNLGLLVVNYGLCFVKYIL